MPPKKDKAPGPSSVGTRRIGRSISASTTDDKNNKSTRSIKSIKSSKLKRQEDEEPNKIKVKSSVNSANLDNRDNPDNPDDEEVGELANDEIDEDFNEDDEDEDFDEDFDEDGDGDDEECAYDALQRDKTGLNLDNIDDDDDYIDDDMDDVDPNLKNYKRIAPASERICTNLITKYERVRLISDRTAQLALGAKPMIRGIENIKHYDREKMIAQLEFEARVIPIIIERERPDGVFEEWKISELKYKDNMIVYGKEAFSDPKTLSIDPIYIEKRTKELQSGGNIKGFAKVTQNPAFNININASDRYLQNKNNLTPLESLLGLDDMFSDSKKNNKTSSKK